MSNRENCFNTNAEDQTDEQVGKILRLCDELGEFNKGIEFIRLLDAMQRYADQQTASLREQLDQVKKVLTELVILKNMKVLIESKHTPRDIANYLKADYEKRKPLAWEAARKLVSQPPNQPELPASEQ